MAPIIVDRMTKDIRDELLIPGGYGLKSIQTPEGFEAVIIDGMRTGLIQEPDEYYIEDPLTGDFLLLCTKRGGQRKESASKKKRNIVGIDNCPICVGDTTPIFFYKDHKRGITFAFTNSNMNSVLSPEGRPNQDGKNMLYGMHLLTWYSNEHKPLEQLSPEQIGSGYSMLGHLENILESSERTVGWRIQSVGNIGTFCGQSLPHPHIQSLLMSRTPTILIDDIVYAAENGRGLMEDETDKALSKNGKSEILEENDSAYLVAHLNAKKPGGISIVPKRPKLEKHSAMTEKEKEDFGALELNALGFLEYTIENLNREYGIHKHFHAGKGVGTMYTEFSPNTQTSGTFEFGRTYFLQKTPANIKAEYDKWKDRELCAVH